MSEDVKQSVNTNSVAFKGGIQSGLNAAEETKNWEAGNELGQEPKAKVEIEAPVDKERFRIASVPLFMRDSRDGNKRNAQDEKDEMAE